MLFTSSSFSSSRVEATRIQFKAIKSVNRCHARLLSCVLQFYSNLSCTRLLLLAKHSKLSWPGNVHATSPPNGCK